MAHALPAHLGAGDLHAAAVADLALEADLLILTAVALPVLRRPENALAEQAVALGLQSTVVDGLGIKEFYLLSNRNQIPVQISNDVPIHF